MSLRRVAILGATGSGKSWLAQALTASLTRSGQSVQGSDTFQACLSPPRHGATWVALDWAVTEAVMPSPVFDRDLTTLLMGLDLPGIGPEQLRQDGLLRQALSLTHTPFRIVYGRGMDRLNNALLALGLPNDQTPSGQDRALAQFKINRGRDTWQCNDCSDPACEHKLFTGLLAKRSA